LTRRANQWHLAIIAKSDQGPRGDIRGGLFVCLIANRTAAARHDATSVHAPCLASESEPPSELLQSFGARLLKKS
jgi:hypothetical protein